MKGLLVAGTSSGVGKTTIAVGLIAALRRRGLVVQPFKVGPDYIDTSYHTRAAAGRRSRNLDRWLLSGPVLRQLYRRAMRQADVAVVEGVMGLFDGRLGGEGLASSAHVARELGLPVVLVVDAGKLSWSAGAVVLGYREFDPGLKLAGVILNRVGGPRHAAEVTAAIETRAGLPVLGWLATDPRLTVPERYLGLVPTTEGTTAESYFGAAESAVEDAIDLDRLLRLAECLELPGDDAADVFPTAPQPARAAIAVAQDQAFSFYYQDSLDLLEAWGAELVPFSPVGDGQLPPGASGVYLGGGFPELFAAELSQNAAMLAAQRQAQARNLPMYAECGGLMLLGRSLVDADGRRHAMAGVVPLDSTFAGQRLTIGYRQARAARDSLLLDAGQEIVAHEFHWSDLARPPAESEAAYTVADREPLAEGYARGNTLVSYLHLHFASDGRGSLARRFVERAAASAGAGAPALVLGGPPPPAREYDGSSVTGSVTGSVVARHSFRQASPEASQNPDCSVSVFEGSPQASPEASPEASHGAGGAATTLLGRYGRPPAEIERLSLARLEQQAGSMLPAEPAARQVALRVLYAAGDPSLAAHIAVHPRAVAAGVAALRAGASVVVDVDMVAAGLQRDGLRRLGCPLVVAIQQPKLRQLAADSGITRSAAAMRQIADHLGGAVVGIGNAPTALLELLDRIDAGAPRPALIVGMPVGLVAAAESKVELVRREVPFVTVLGTRGGSPLAAAALNALVGLAAHSGAETDAG